MSTHKINENGKIASIIIIGNEILSGKVVDQNASYLSQALRAIGVKVERIVFIPDRIGVIAEEIRSNAHFDLIFTCGGIGPTHDDVTIAGIALAVDQPLIQHPILVQHLKKVYGPMINSAQMRMAEVPEGTELIFSESLRVPVLQHGKIYIFPGIPELVVKKFEAIKERFREAPFHLTKIYLSQREDAIVGQLRETLQHYPRLLLGSYPILHQPDHKILLTLESKEKDYLNEAERFLISSLPEGALVKIEKVPSN